MTGTAQEQATSAAADNVARPDAGTLARDGLDGLTSSIAFLDGSGAILLVNAAWRRFAQENDSDPGAVSEGANYLEICARVTGDDAAAGREEWTRYRSGPP